MTYPLQAFAHYVSSAVGVTGLTVTIDVFQVTRSSGAVSQIVTAGGATEVGDGIYLYTIASADLSIYAYVSVFKTAGTADQKWLPSLWYDFAVGQAAAIAANPDTSGTTTLLSRIASALNISGGNVALTTAEHTAIASDVQTGMTAQGATTTRMGYLDVLNGIVAAVVNGVLDVAASAHNIALSIGAKINAVMLASGYTTPPTVGQIDTQLSGTHGAGAWGGAAGSGPITWHYTLTNFVTTLPVPQAYIRATTDLAGLNTVAEGTTDNFGVVTFYLTAGTYYIWRAKAGWQFINPDVENV